MTEQRARSRSAQELLRSAATQGHTLASSRRRPASRRVSPATRRPRRRQQSGRSRRRTGASSSSSPTLRSIRSAADRLQITGDRVRARRMPRPRRGRRPSGRRPGARRRPRAWRAPPGERVVALVDPLARHATECNHTATHLLHAALRQRLGPHVRQAGSYVGPDKLRFDFSHGAALSAGELRDVEDQINRWILENHSVRGLITTLEEARRLGAMALFGEKYGEVVRMVEVGKASSRASSAAARMSARPPRSRSARSRARHPARRTCGGSKRSPALKRSPTCAIATKSSMSSPRSIARVRRRSWRLHGPAKPSARCPRAAGSAPRASTRA